MGDGERAGRPLLVTPSPLLFSFSSDSLGHSPLRRSEADTSSLNNLSRDFLVHFRLAVCRFPLRLKRASTHWGDKNPPFFLERLMKAPLVALSILLGPWGTM